MTETEKLEYTKSFIDKLANGINPIDNTPIPDGDLLNNIRISRCMFYVSDILRQVIENSGSKKGKKSQKVRFAISPEQLKNYDFGESSISVSEISKRIYALTDNANMEKLSYKDITSWLLQAGLLCEKANNNNELKKQPTPDGESIGITYERRRGLRGDYDAVLYNKEAQQFILDNIEAIISLKYNLTES